MATNNTTFTRPVTYIPEVINLTDPRNVTRLAIDYRRRIILSSALAGDTLMKAGTKAGYAPQNAVQTASSVLSRPETQDTYRLILERAGLTDEFLAGKTMSLLNAQHTVFAQKDGRFTDTRVVPALETQRKTLEMAHKLAGHLKDKSEIDVRVGIVTAVLDAIQDGK